MKKIRKNPEFFPTDTFRSFRQTVAAIISGSSVGRMVVRSFNREMRSKAEIALDETAVRVINKRQNSEIEILIRSIS
jgi:hypothetical protein